eukprot:356947-Chlamydomonas_euryale.AAC.1
MQPSGLMHTAAGGQASVGASGTFAMQPSGLMHTGSSVNVRTSVSGPAAGCCCSWQPCRGSPHLPKPETLDPEPKPKCTHRDPASSEGEIKGGGDWNAVGGCRSPHPCDPLPKP